MKFSERLKVDEWFKAYCEECGVRYCVASFLAWLQATPEGIEVMEKLREEKS